MVSAYESFHRNLICYKGEPNTVYLTIIPRARMGSESIALAHEVEPWPNGLLTQRPLREEQQL